MKYILLSFHGAGSGEDFDMFMFKAFSLTHNEYAKFHANIFAL